MTFAVPVHRPSSTVRRFGYLLAAVVNAAPWYVINARPGWPIVPFLTEDTRQVFPFAFDKGRRVSPPAS